MCATKMPIEQWMEQVNSWAFLSTRINFWAYACRDEFVHQHALSHGTLQQARVLILIAFEPKKWLNEASIACYGAIILIV